MLTSRSLTATTGTTEIRLSAVLDHMEKDGWTPALLESNRTFLRLAGANVDDAGRIRKRRTAPYDTIEGDVFFRDDGIYYIINLGRELSVYEYLESSYSRAVLRERGAEYLQPRLISGIISSVIDDIDQRLQEFSSVITTAVSSTHDLDDNEQLDWQHETAISKLDRIQLGDDSEASPSFVPAALTSDDVRGSTILADRLPRELLIAISRSGFARQQDILAERKGNRDRSNLESAISHLKQNGLIKTQYLLECKTKGIGLTRVDDRSQLEGEVVSNFECPACGQKFANENITEGYQLSGLGQRLSRKSQWMTVWVTDLLVKLGVETGSILWNISEHGEEVDLLIEHCSQVWIFELKSREFGAGDAHPLNYRRSLYDADKAIIVTTDMVSPDAKRVLDEVVTEGRRSPSGQSRQKYIYIEGLDSAESQLRKLLSDAAVQEASRKLRQLGEMYGISFAPILRARGEQSSRPVAVSHEE